MAALSSGNRSSSEQEFLDGGGYFIGEFLVHGQFCLGDDGGHNIRQTRQSFHLRALFRRRLGPIHDYDRIVDLPRRT